MNPNDVIRLNTGARRMRAALAFCMAVLIIFGFRLFQLQALDAPPRPRATMSRCTRR